MDLLGYEYVVTTSPTPPENGIYTTVITVTSVLVIPNTDMYLHVRAICSEEDGASILVTYAFLVVIACLKVMNLRSLT